jgi:excisionase family DNA binding protein
MNDGQLKAGQVSARQKEFSTIKELAQMIGLCYRTVHRAAIHNKFKTVMFGASRLVPRAEVERILQRGF